MYYSNAWTLASRRRLKTCYANPCWLRPKICFQYFMHFFWTHLFHSWVMVNWLVMKNSQKSNILSLTALALGLRSHPLVFSRSCITHEGLSTLLPSVQIFWEFSEIFWNFRKLIFFLWTLMGLKRLKFLGCTRIFSSRQPLDYAFRCGISFVVGTGTERVGQNV